MPQVSPRNLSQCDLAAELLAGKGVRVKCMPDAGVFPHQSGFDWIADNMHAKAGLPAACVSAMGDDWRQCMHAEVSLERTAPLPPLGVKQWAQGALR